MVRQDATTSEIRTAFRTLIGKWHPDVASSSDAQERSASIIQAYRTLSHAERRSQHDRRQRSAGPPGGRDRRRNARRERPSARARATGSSAVLRALTLAWALVAGVTVAAGLATELPDRGDDIVWLVRAS